jgi:hypothetical protein
MAVVKCHAKSIKSRKARPIPLPSLLSPIGDRLLAIFGEWDVYHVVQQNLGLMFLLSRL